MSEVKWDELVKPFPKSQITVVNKGHGPMDTVNHAVVTSRLIASAGDWSYTVDEAFTLGKSYWLRITLTIGGTQRSEYGEGQDPKKALSDALKRAAMRFGVGLDLWAKAPLDDYDVGEPPAAPSTAPSPVLPESLSSGSAGVEVSGSPTTPETVGTATPAVSGINVGTGEEGTLSFGEGESGPEGPGADPYLTAKEANELAKALGAGGLDRARQRYGERIRSFRDLKRSMALELVSEKVA